MEVHAHTHTPRKKWTHYFWEFLMLFLAVTLGFFVENWREHYIEHKRAGQYAEMMREDLLKDTKQLGELIRGTEDLKLSERIWKRVYGMPIVRITVADIDSLTNPGIDLSRFAWNDATYSQMKSSGTLRLFSEKDLVRKLALYESYIKEIGFFNKNIDDAFSSEYLLKASYYKSKFFENNPDIKGNVLLKQAGYNFNGWEMEDAITQRIISYQLILRDIYPEIKKTAAEIIDLLKKEYRLK
ncbi:MAG: hypothetical protein ABIO81_02040 [Ginsengibacter sp.]